MSGLKRVVIDSNQLQSPSLRSFLSASRSNFAVIPDPVSIEAYAGNPLSGISRRMSVLEDFPRQVVVLKSTENALRMSPRSRGLQKRLIDDTQTREFPEYIRKIRLARNGDESVLGLLEDLSNRANAHRLKLLVDAEVIRQEVAGIAAHYSKSERTSIRSRSAPSQELIVKTGTLMLDLAAAFFRARFPQRSLPTYSELPNTFIFRATICTFLSILERSANGESNTTSPEKIRNDMIDSSIAAYATYFDGLMTADTKCERIYADAKAWIEYGFR